MSDMALAYDPTAMAADLCITEGDLAIDGGLQSLAVMSLMTDARALPSDVDAGERDLRGWWGDAIADRPLGGRLWTLERAKATAENRRRAASFAREALQWMVDDGIAARVDVVATRRDGEGSGATLALDITITRPAGGTEKLIFDALWRALE